MKRQLVKGMTMLLMVVALAFVSAVASAYGQTARADVPFEFVAAGRTLAAGHYEISAANSTREFVRIRNNGTEQSTMMLTIAATKNRVVEEGKLVFRRYGNRYFLAEIWNAGESEGRQLLKSKEEKAIARELASIKSNTKTGPERVEIALVKR
jgi:hypothetical protein